MLVKNAGCESQHLCTTPTTTKSGRTPLGNGGCGSIQAIGQTAQCKNEVGIQPRYPKSMGSSQLVWMSGLRFLLLLVQAGDES